MYNTKDGLGQPGPLSYQLLERKHMSASRKFLKIISMVTIISGISYVIAAAGFVAVGMFGGMDTIALDNMPIAMPAEAAGILLAAIAGGNAILNLVLGFLGLRAANVPSKIGPVYVLTIISLVANIINLVFCFFQGFGVDVAHTFSVVLGLVCAIVMFVLANNVKKEHETWH